VMEAQPFLPVERLVANKADGASLCQRRQPPKAGAEGQRLQRLAPSATIGHASNGLIVLVYQNLFLTIMASL